MRKLETEHFRTLLLAKKQALVDQIHGIRSDAARSQRDASGDLSAYTFHMADVASDIIVAGL